MCALLVSLYHLPIDAWVHFNPIVRGSYLFVDFFFVLSGFVIGKTYAGRLRDGPSVVEFLLKRVGRLWPVHLATLLCLLALLMAANLVRHLFGSTPLEAPTTVPRFLINAFLLNGLGIEGLDSINVPSWSISCELMVYGLFCVSLLAGRSSLALWLVTAAVCAALIARYSPIFMDASNAYGIARCVYGFAFGLAAKATYERLADRYRPGTWGELLAIAAVLAFVVLCHDSVWSILAPVVFYAVVLVFSLESGRVSNVMRQAPFRFLGRLSFALYMSHFVVMMALLQLAFTLRRVHPGRHGLTLIDAGGEVGGMLLTAAYLVLVVVAAWITHLWVEEPCRKRSYEWARAIRLRLLARRASSRTGTAG